MTYDVCLVRAGGEIASGQQVFQRELLARLQVASGLRIADLTIVPFRAGRDAGVRFPHLLARHLPPRSQELLTRLAFPAARLFHRFDLRLPSSPRPELLTVLDLAWHHFDDELRPAKEIRVRKMISRARGIVTCSEASRVEILTRYSPACDVVVIPLGYDEELPTCEPLASDQLAALDLDRPFALASGGRTKRKNMDMLLSAWRESELAAMGMKLAITGGGDVVSGEGVVGLGVLERPVLRGLIKSATMVVSASLYEGFGLPGLEAMAAHVPVVAVETPAVREVCQDGALFVEASTADLAAGLRRVVEDNALRSALVLAGDGRAKDFSWDRCAARHQRLYRDLST